MSKIKEATDGLKETISSLNSPPVDLKGMISGMVPPNFSPRIRARQYVYVTTYKGSRESDDDCWKLAHLTIFGCPEDLTNIGDIDLDDTTVYENAMPDGSKMMADIEQMVSEFYDSVDMLAMSAGSVVKGLAALIPEAVAAVAGSANQLITIPPQPMAAAATLLSFNNKVGTFASSMSPLMTALPGLNNLSVVLPVGDLVDTAETAIAGVITTIDTSLKAIGAIKI